MRQPPRSLEAESGLIGSVLIDDEAYSYASEIAPDDFSTAQHRAVWRAITEIAQRGDVLDIVSVGDELSRQGLIDEAGGYSSLSGFMASTPTSANAKSYADSVRTKATLRRLITAETTTAYLWYDATVVTSITCGSATITPNAVSGLSANAIQGIEIVQLLAAGGVSASTNITFVKAGDDIVIPLNFVCENKYGQQDVLFLNKYGVYDSFLFNNSLVLPPALVQPCCRVGNKLRVFPSLLVLL